MSTLIGAIAYIVVGYLLTKILWKLILAEYANKDKKFLLYLCWAIVILIWPFWVLSVLIGLIGGGFEALITREQPKYSKVPIVLFIMFLAIMYGKMWNVNVFADSFEGYVKQTT